jgi:hypothetical protein
MDNNELLFQAHDLEGRYKSGARWFFWIAGLTIVTSILALSNSNFSFFLSLGVTQIIDGFAKGLAEELGDTARFVGLILDVLIAGVFVVIGWLALKRQLWAFVVGMVIFALDALVLLAFQVWLSFIFHALVIFWIFRGYQAGRELIALESEMRARPPAPPQDLGQTAPEAATPTP